MLNKKHLYQNVDCLDGIRKLPSRSVQLIQTDPPYNISRKRKLTRKSGKDINLDFGEWDNFESLDEYKKWANEWIEECSRVLDDDGHIFIWQDKLLPLKDILEENGFEIRNVFIWIKANPVPQFMKVNFLSSVEFAIWATKKGSKRKDQVFNFTDQRTMHNVVIDKEVMALSEFIAGEKKHEMFVDEELGLVAIKTPIVMGKERLNHATQKPLSITEKIIQLFTNENDVVLDLFSGSGTTFHACIRTNRIFWGFEKGKGFYDMGLERVGPFLKNIDDIEQ